MMGALEFSTTASMLARKDPKARPPPSKKALAAKERKRARKAPKSVYEHEKMPLLDAIQVLRAVEVARPNTTYELVIKTAMPKGASVPKGRISFPRPVKEEEKARDIIAVFAEGRLADEAKRAGADHVGGAEMADAVASGRIQATTFLCTPALLRTITPKLGRILGPRGLMPSERRGTVTEDIAGYIEKLQGTTEWKGDPAGTIRTPIGKLHWSVEEVAKNVSFFLQTVKRATGNVKETGLDPKKDTKPTNAITRVILSSTYGPAIRLVV
jgi:large subunit ribosomal protein L1